MVVVTRKATAAAAGVKAMADPVEVSVKNGMAISHRGKKEITNALAG
jgi:hypothetical protein